MEEEEDSNGKNSRNNWGGPQSTSLRERNDDDHHHHHHHHNHHNHNSNSQSVSRSHTVWEDHNHLHSHNNCHNNQYPFHNLHHNPNSYRLIGFFNQNPGLLPLPPLLPFQFPVHHIQNHRIRPKTSFPKPYKTPLNHIKPPASTVLPAEEGLEKQLRSLQIESCGENVIETQALVVAKRPDSGGLEGQVISLLANHFQVTFHPSHQIFHYDVEISPNCSKGISRAIKRKLVEENPGFVSGAYDGRKNLYSPVEFQGNRLEFFVSLPVNCSTKSGFEDSKMKLFRVNIRLVSKLDGNELIKYLSNEGGDDWIPLPQEYLHALDVVWREAPNEKCIPIGRSLYSTSMGGAMEIGGGALGLRGFFQSLRPTQQGLALNVDFSVTAFHESIGVLPYLQKRLKFLHDLSRRKDVSLTTVERKEVEKELKNIRVFVSHRETIQRYRFHCLTEEITEKLSFEDRDGSRLKVVDYFKDQYDYDIQYRNLPCLQMSRSKPCYLPMELCVICDGQKFLGKLSDDQTARIMKMGSQRPRERRTIINGVINGPVGPTSGNQAEEFKLEVSREMTRLSGRILRPPKLKLGAGGLVRDVFPSRVDRQWNLLGAHVVEGTQIKRWALMSFGGTQDQKSKIPNFIHNLCLRCEQFGIFLNKSSTINPQFETMNVLNNVTLLESKLNKIKSRASNNLQLLLCLMEKKHKGYGDLKRIAETRVGVISQCCLYPNLGKLNSQFLANLALKINAKVGGSTVALFNSLPSQIPRLLSPHEPVIFMGADATHPHPLDDYSPSVAAVVGSINWPSANKYVSRMRSQTHRQEIIEDLGEMVGEILTEFRQEVNNVPRRIIFFRDGVSETQFYKVLKEELHSIREGCRKFFPNYKPLITFAVVQKRHHTRLFPDENDPFFGESWSDSIPPGTVVDTVITHPREFDFYLCSHWGVKGTSRPTHYHILWDENKFTSDELQKLVYSLCFTFVRCTKPISIVPPAYYAHLAAYRERLYLEKSETGGSTKGGGGGGGGSFSRVGTPKAAPLPKISENVQKLMFYC